MYHNSREVFHVKLFDRFHIPHPTYTCSVRHLASARGLQTHLEEPNTELFGHRLTLFAGYLQQRRLEGT